MSTFEIEHSQSHLIRVRHQPRGSFFGQLVRQQDLWHAEIRETATGNLYRYAGQWGRQKDGIAELQYLLDTPEFR